MSGECNDCQNLMCICDIIAEDEAKGSGASTCSAADLLRAEAERLGGLRTERPIRDDLRWVYSVAAAWLDCRNDPSTIHRWQEIPKQNHTDKDA